MTYFLDANIISYVIKGVPSVISRLKTILFCGDEIKIPVIAYYEVKRGLLAINANKKLAIFEEQMKLFEIVQMDLQTFEIASSVYAKLKSEGTPIDDADLFIGSSVLENNAILITNNKKHLSKISNLIIEELS